MVVGKISVCVCTAQSVREYAERAKAEEDLALAKPMAGKTKK